MKCDIIVMQAAIEDTGDAERELTPGRDVGAAEVEDDGEPFEEKMERLTAQLEAESAESARLEAAIWENLKGPQAALHALLEALAGEEI